MSPSPAADIRIGTVLRETYELTSLLGKGGMGSVFLARHLRLPGKQVAVKILLHSEDLSEEQYARFRREAEIASQLGHPNIVEVIDFHSLEDGTPYLVMEHLRGESLAHRLRKGRLSLREVFSIARQMGSALQAAHRAGVVHRDLKPANVFLVPSEAEGLPLERVKLLDFGISKLMGSQTLQTQEDVLMGTPRYMAPEQAMGRNKDVDARSDIFAFGCIVYEMLCGDSPFAGGTIAEVVYRVVHEMPESLATRLPDLPARAVAAVDKALAKAPKDRYADVGTFIEELTGTPLQTLARLGADPAPLRGAARPNEPSLHADESATDATFVPSRSGVARPGSEPAHEPSVEAGSTLAAFRAQEAQAAEVHPPTMTSSRRPTNLELAAVPPAATPAPVAASVAPAAQPSPAPVAPPSAPVPEPVAPPSVAPVSSAPPAARSQPPRVLVGLAIVVLIAGGILLGRGLRTTPSAPTQPGPAQPVTGSAPPVEPAPNPGTEPSPGAPAVATTTPTPAPTAPVEPTPVQPESPQPTPTAHPTAKPPPAHTPKDKPEIISGPARQALDEARHEFESGNFEKAIRIASRAQNLQKTTEGRELLIQAHCSRHDLSNARKEWLKLPASRQKELQGFCARFDIELMK